MITVSAMSRIFMVFLFCGMCPIIHSQEGEDIVQDLDGIKDPFLSQLPEPVVIPKQPVVAPVEFVPKNVIEKVPVDVPIIVPNIPEVVKKPNMDSFVLKGLVWNSDTPQVIINDKVMDVGDEINGMRIVTITRDGVEFSSNGVTTFLKMSKQKGAVAGKP